MESFGNINKSLKAYASMVVTAVGYLVGVLQAKPEGHQSLGDVSQLQWLGLIIFMGTSYGLTYAVRNTAGSTPVNRG